VFKCNQQRFHNFYISIIFYGYMKKIIVIAPSLLVVLAFLTISTNWDNNANAIQGYCPPICLGEVNEHVKDAIKALDKSDIPTAKSELDIVKSLLDQLKDMTSPADSE
jgi:hypothetical protein